MTATKETRMATTDGRTFVGAECTLDGKPATICGRRNRFATVATLPTGPTYDYAWQTVAHVMTTKEGAFTS
jgi:hypothetical protein